MRSTTLNMPTRPRGPRRGVTLIEMLVSVALLVLMMSVIVQVFVVATDAVSASKTFQELDGGLRQLDATLRTDLRNVTARFTPPQNPAFDKGYFEYTENSFADNQNEDSDDVLRFTVTLPEGQYFTGRFWPSSLAYANFSALSDPLQVASYANSHPITLQSRSAEVIYFLRNQNLYRRVLLVLDPAEFGGSLIQSSPPGVIPGAFGGAGFPDPSNHFALASWQAMNDISVRTNLSDGFVATDRYVLNNLQDLVNRENRFASPRFRNDFKGNADPTSDPDGLLDDQNQDSVPDFYPTLYPGAFSNAGRTGLPAGYPALINEPPGVNRAVIPGGGTGSLPDMMAFPFIFPGAYSRPVLAQANAGMGWIHGPDPSNAQLTLADINRINHNPLEIGDSLPFPQAQGTWWGLPTWRETLSAHWQDPYRQSTTTGWQPPGLRPRDPLDPTQQLPLNYQPSLAERNRVPLLPPMTGDYRVIPQLNNDGAGGEDPLTSFAYNPVSGSNASVTRDYLWNRSWEDDLIMTGVRSFDVKAYDDAYGGYVDLGWGNDLREYAKFSPTGTLPNGAQAPVLGHISGYLTGVPDLYGNNVNVIRPFLPWPPLINNTWPHASGSGYFDLVGQTFAHEGRIPPLVIDNRPDYQYPASNPNLGDNQASVVRLRRVWDTWSTDYSYAPGTAVLNDPSNILYYEATVGPGSSTPFKYPVYPSYPPPYPMALRGVQVQIKVVDPRNERMKVLTIRQDFSDKL